MWTVFFVAERGLGDGQFETLLAAAAWLKKKYRKFPDGFCARAYGPTFVVTWEQLQPWMEAIT
jgi:hypothetical protein